MLVSHAHAASGRDDISVTCASTCASSGTCTSSGTCPASGICACSGCGASSCSGAFKLVEVS